MKREDHKCQHKEQMMGQVGQHGQLHTMVSIFHIKHFSLILYLSKPIITIQNLNTFFIQIKS